MTEITVHPVDTSTERKIITALIVSTKFCAQIIPILRPEYIEVDYVKIVIRWVTNYFKEYKKAPANHIQDLFEQNRKRLKPAMAEIIEAFLITLSENYVLDNTEETSFNSDYYIDLAYEHFRERSLQLHLSIVNSLLEQGKRKEAGEEVEKFRQLQKDIYPYETLTPEVVERVLIRRDTASMLTFPGKMGNLIGGIERGWLISFLGPMKRGKCLDGGTEILLSNGKIRTIKQMFDKKLNKKKYKVVVLNDEYNLVEGNVLDVICNGEQSIYKVRTRTGKEI